METPIDARLVPSPNCQRGYRGDLEGGLHKCGKCDGGAHDRV